MTFALQHRDRVRCIRLEIPISKLQRLVNAFDREFPILEYLYIHHQPTFEFSTNLIFPGTFRTPHLRHLLLMKLAILIGSTLLLNMRNIVTVAQPHPTLCLTSTRILYSNDCHTCLSWRHSGSPLTPTIPAVTLGDDGFIYPIRMRVTLPNLHWLGFKGTSAYLETLLPRLTVPLLEKLQVYFFNQLTYPITTPSAIDEHCREHAAQYFHAHFS